MEQNIGISAIGISIPPFAMKLSELAKLHNVNPDKYNIGLGCNEMALCPSNFSIVDLAEIAARRALDNWSGNLEDLGMVAIGTESGLDMSRPLASWVMERLNLKGAIRSYEVKHACFGGTLAIRQAVEWKLSSNSQNKAALVIAVDQGLYAFAHPGEPTQGSAAVAFIIDKADIAKINPISYAWSSPEYDFWRPVGEAYPNVNGRLSMECYKSAVIECFKQLMQNSNNLEETLNNYAYCCFHIPFPKMVIKAFSALCEKFGLDKEKITKLFFQKIKPSLEWNVDVGNCYTASLWLSVAKALNDSNKNDKLLAFSYGSGFGAELLSLTATNTNKNSYWQKALQADFDNRKFITKEEYLMLREVKKVPSTVVDSRKKIVL